MHAPLLKRLGPTAVDLAREELLTFLRIEQIAADREYVERYNLPVKARIAAGDTIGPMALISQRGEELTFSLIDNDSRFREGDRGWVGPAAVGEGQLRRGLPVEFVRFDQANRLLFVNLDTMAKLEFGTPDLRGQVYFDERKSDLTDMYRDVVHHALDPDHIAPLVRSMVLSESSSTCHELWHAYYDAGVALKLDQSQCAAFAAQARRPLALIQGPPGTGKTSVLSAVVAGLLEEGKRVLVCSLAHRAANNALNGCAKREQITAPIVKFSARHQASDLQSSVTLVEYGKEIAKLMKQSDGPIVVGTAVARVRGLVTKGVQFDAVIFDEAGQLTLPQLLCGAIAAPRAILFGDHKQLPPIIQGEHGLGAFNLRRSGLEILHDTNPSEMLTTSYRLNNELARFPSSEFYGNKLKASPKRPEEQYLQVHITQLHPLSGLLDPRKPLTWGALEHRFQTVPCDEEAEIAATCALLALDSGIEPQEIGILSPFRKQNRAIRNYLAMLSGPGQSEQIDNIVVDTVERMQGQERDLIIVSFGISNHLAIEQNAPFIYSPNRLNVSITRARKKCIILGSAELIRPNSDDPTVVDGSLLFQRLMAAAEVVPVPTGLLRTVRPTETAVPAQASFPPLHSKQSREGLGARLRKFLGS